MDYLLGFWILWTLGVLVSGLLCLETHWEFKVLKAILKAQGISEGIREGPKDDK